MESTIREAALQDFKGVFPLLKQLWPSLSLDFNKLENIFKKGIESNSQRYIVCTVENNLVGFCSLTIKNNLWQAGNLAHIDELVVDELHRGKGYGKQLIDSITKIAIENNCKRIELDSAFHRSKSHSFYESIGYEKRGYLLSKLL